MPPMVCRITLRAGEPLGLLTYPRPTFLSLPFEIRTQIYELLLISPGHVTAFPCPSFKPRFSCFTPGLLLANRTIAAEAAALFYERNTFKLGHSGDVMIIDGRTDIDGSIVINSWDALYSFLLLIGARNRAFLRHIEIDIAQSRAVRVDAQGSVSSLAIREPGSSWLRKVHARDQHIRTYPPVGRWAEAGSYFDYISPAIEAVFRLLGHEGSKLQLSLLMLDMNLPQIEMADGGYLSGWSGEVPNFIEIMRRRFTCGSNEKPRVDVLWKGEHPTSKFKARLETLEKDGWDILEMAEIYGPQRRYTRGPTSYITLQRRSIDSSSSPEFFLSGHYIPDH